MATLSGRLVNAVYQGFLNVDNSGLGIDSTLRTIQDGLGNATPCQVSTSYYNFTGLKYNGNILSFAGAVTFSGAFATTITVTGTTNVTLPTSGTIVSSTNTGTTVFAASNWPIAVVTSSGNLSLGNAGTGSLAINTVIIDTNGILDAVGHRLLVNVAGYYLVTLQAACTAGASPTKAISGFIYKNGSIAPGYNGGYSPGIPTTQADTAIQATAIVQCNGTTDYITAQFTDGGNTNGFTVLAGSSLSIQRIG